MRLRKLTPEQICQIPQLRQDDCNISEIARMFDVTPSAIRRIINEEIWLRYNGQPAGKPARCPDCGGMVFDDSKPCMVCANRRAIGKPNG